MKRNKNSGLVFYEKKKTISRNQVYQVISWAGLILAAILLAWVTVFAFGMKTSVVGDSMRPALINGQEVLIDRISYSVFQPKKGDIIVFKPNGNENVHTYVKRIVAGPGDRVQILNGILYLNGQPQANMFPDSIVDAGVAADEIVIGEDEFFVMGDNCNSSEDSRTANIGNVRSNTIIGKAWLHLGKGSMGIGRL
ncbi:MAG: signal peptidase I [Lachnospiraceae bacterium]|nr:signal peptidase I [Lachnospiraceae bacterium]